MVLRLLPERLELPAGAVYAVMVEAVGGDAGGAVSVGQRLGVCFESSGSPSRNRSATLMQHLVRVAAGAALGAANGVAAVWATFALEQGGAVGRLMEWVDGRPWKLETDRRVWARPAPGPNPDYREPVAPATEYGAKRFFMARLARLLRELGAPGLAACYAWRGIHPTRVMCRLGSGGAPYGRMAAVDFPWRPCAIGRLRDYAAAHPEALAAWAPLVEELCALEPAAQRARDAVRRVPRVVPARSVRAGGAAGSRCSRLEPVRRLTDPERRTAWLLQQARAGREEGMLTPDEAQRIEEQAHDPLIQLYLKCLAVHLCLLPTTNVVVIAGGFAYALAHHLSFAEGMRMVVLALAFFAVFPASPGSLARGLYVLAVVLRRRRLRHFRVALACSFWRYVGYSAFPLQMVTTFPALARFLAARAATHMARHVPRWGRRGGLLEYRVFDLWFNLPLSVGQWWRTRRGARLHVDRPRGERYLCRRFFGLRTKERAN